MRRTAWLVAGVLAAAVQPAPAHWSASRGTSIYARRYLVCTEHPQVRVECAGPIRARGQLLAAIAGGDEDRAHGAMVHAVYYNVRDAIAPLRSVLARKLAPGERGDHRFFEKQGLRAEAAYALAHLGDAASAGAIHDLVVEFETDGYGFLWQDTLEAYALIDRGGASRYAIEFLHRTSGFRTSLPGGSSQLFALDKIVRADAATALPVLLELTTREKTRDDHAYCRLMATRTRLDETLRAKVRSQFIGSYSGTWLPLCANDVFAQLGDPADPADAAALVRHLGRDDRGMDFGMANLAYQRILDLELALQRRPDPAATAVIRRGLVERSAWPHVADPTHANYSRHFVALHEAALAGLGDAAARGALYKLIDDARDTSGAAWIAALWALRLQLPGAADHVAGLIERGVAVGDDNHSGLFENIRSRVLDEYADRFPDDPRWTVVMLDGDTRLTGDPTVASERAVYRLARHAPAGTCEAVTKAARHVPVEAAEHAFLALTMLGATCMPALQHALDDRANSGEVRGAALEMLGALDDPELAARIDHAAREGVWKPAIERARLWLNPKSIRPSTRSPAKPAQSDGPHEQPLPPRTFKQGM